MPPARLILMRHASAAAGTGRDFDRPLTRRGLSEAQGVGERLRALDVVPDRVLASSAKRCRETFDALASGLGEDAPLPTAVDFADGLYNASTQALLEAIRDIDASRTLLVLAHNPGISLLALELGRHDPEQESVLRQGFAPATTAVFEVKSPWSDLDARSARLVRLERPRPEHD